VHEQFTEYAPTAVVERPQPTTASGPPNRRTVWLLLGLATIVAAGLRLPFLGHQSLWLDEIFTRQILREPTLSGLWHHIEATESTPPLYYLLGWLLHARSTVAMRLISALALIAAVPVGYLAFRRLVGWRAALATAWILAVSPILVSYSTDARSYGLFVLTALLSVWAFSVLLDRTSPRQFALWVIASVACVWTHYFGASVVAAEVIVLLVALPRVRLATTGCTSLLALCLVPLVPLVTSQAGDERAEFIAGIPLSTRLSETVRQFAMGPNVPRTWLETAGVVLFCLAVGAGAVMAARSRDGPRVLLALAVIVFGAPLLMAALGIEDRFYARNVIALAPLAAALAALALLRLHVVPLAIYLLLAAVTSVWVATDWRYEQVNWKGALARAETINRAATVIAVTRLGAPVIETYLARRPAPPSGVLTARAWVIVEPVRAAGHRYLGPAAVPTLPGFTALRTFQVDAFKLVLVGADHLTRITPGEVAGTSVFLGGSSPSR
jgi:4-amino-4-deoxy-L-arabinose transferase-like glycosyltransferase